jgi:hypothetical protein
MLKQSARWPRLAGIGLIVGGVMVANVVLTSTTAGAKPTAASGTITCSTVTGTVTFKPGLTNTARTVKMKATLAISPSGCSTVIVGPDGIGAIAVGHTTNYNSSKSNIYKLTGGDCGSLNGVNAATPSKWTTKWISPVGTAPSKVTFSGFDGEADPDGTVLSYPNTSGEEIEPRVGGGGTASGSGSYPGSDDFASSTQQLDSTMTASQVTTACDSSTGLTSLTISSGTIHIG